MRTSPPSEYTEIIFFNVNLIFGKDAEAYSEPCQTSQMELVLKINNSFLFFQNVPSYIFAGVPKTLLRWFLSEIYYSIDYELTWSDPTDSEIAAAKDAINPSKLINISNICHTEESLSQLQEVKIVDIQDRVRPLYLL